MANPRQNEKNATFRFSLSSSDPSNPLGDLTTATAIDFYVWPVNTNSANNVHIVGSAYNSTTVQFSTGMTPPFTLAAQYDCECIVTWPDGGTSKFMVPITIDAAPV